MTTRALPLLLVPSLQLVLLVLPVLAPPAAGEPLTVGDALPALTLEDQHGQERAIDAGVRHVLFARDMDGGGVLKDALSEGGAELLAATGSVYVADVSRMPGLVRRMFVLPSLRRRGYPILLDSDGTATVDFPGQKERATLIELDALRITRVRQFSDKAALRGALEAARPQR
jgi:hypothetical protein